MPSPINPICGRPGCKYKVPHEHVKFGVPEPDAYSLSARKVGVAPELGMGYGGDKPRLGPVKPPEPITDDEVAAIAAAVKRLACSDDPEADRFEGKSPVEVQVTLLGERMAKYADQTDKALAIMSDVTRKTHTTIEACWEHWKADQQRPAWAQDFAEWFEGLMPRKDEIHRIGGDTCTARDNTAFLIGRVDQLLRRRALSVWGVVLGTIIGIYASLMGIMLVIVAAAHTQQFWTWITEGLGI